MKALSKGNTMLLPARVLCCLHNIWLFHSAKKIREHLAHSWVHTLWIEVKIVQHVILCILCIAEGAGCWIERFSLASVFQGARTEPSLLCNLLLAWKRHNVFYQSVEVCSCFMLLGLFFLLLFYFILFCLNWPRIQLSTLLVSCLEAPIV